MDAGQRIWEAEQRRLAELARQAAEAANRPPLANRVMTFEQKLGWRDFRLQEFGIGTMRPPVTEYMDILGVNWSEVLGVIQNPREWEETLLLTLSRYVPNEYDSAAMIHFIGNYYDFTGMNFMEFAFSVDHGIISGVTALIEALDYDPIAELGMSLEAVTRMALRGITPAQAEWLTSPDRHEAIKTIIKNWQ